MLLFLGRTVPTLYIPAIRTTVSNSKDILSYLRGRYGHSNKGKFLLVPDMQQGFELESKFDRLGLSVQRWGYYYLLQTPSLNTFWGVKEPRVPFWQRKLLCAISPILALFLTKILKLSHSKAREEFEIVKETFELTEDLLKDGRKYLLETDEISYIDITFASLSGLISLSEDVPKLYPGRTLNWERDLTEFSEEYVNDMEYLHHHYPLTSKFIERVYLEDRLNF
eukprot:TRINITY_DN1786_c0_g1_i2.p1 TRINITY_DN1786_c0_g1~~TRINITY_DN1786_c0_g1_i2.p1  ORF type:complete len:224 (+),score=29.34 TRINITY_DN1786_c0_g1_i2:775-1446(+)